MASALFERKSFSRRSPSYRFWRAATAANCGTMVLKSTTMLSVFSVGIFQRRTCVALVSTIDFFAFSSASRVTERPGLVVLP